VVRKALIVDDERLARVELRVLLAAHSQIEVVGESDGIAAALEVMGTVRPDLVFLDIQLGAESGFELFERATVPFDVIFVTAFEEHAVRAFEVNALDYLLKPVHPERLAEALERRASNRPPVSPGSATLEADDRLFIRVGDRWRFLKVATIVVIEASGDFSRVLTSDGAGILIGKSLREWEARLPARLFARIHRSTIVNLDHVERVEEWSGQTFHVHVRGLKEPYQMSRRHAGRLKS